MDVLLPLPTSSSSTIFKACVCVSLLVCLCLSVCVTQLGNWQKSVSHAGNWDQAFWQPIECMGQSGTRS